MARADVGMQTGDARSKARHFAARGHIASGGIGRKAGNKSDHRHRCLSGGSFLVNLWAFADEAKGNARACGRPMSLCEMAPAAT
jgi:hypothetical protein